MKKITIPIKIYDSNITIYKGGAIPDIITHFKLDVESVYEADERDILVVVPIPESRDFMLLVSNQKITPGGVAHEALHITNRIFNDIGYTLDPLNDEPQAYFLDWLTDEILNKIEE